MKIPENQLRTWSQLGAQARSQRTYQSIRNALDRHVWPPAMGSPSVYLQGSYRNHTNIAGDSDVDVVVESSGVFYDNLTPEERRLRGFQPGRYSWENFRNEVYGALVTHYSQGKVQQGNKCIHVGGAGDRLNADVIPCCEHRAYGAGGYPGRMRAWKRQNRDFAIPRAVLGWFPSSATQRPFPRPTPAQSIVQGLSSRREASVVCVPASPIWDRRQLYYAKYLWRSALQPWP